MNVPLRSLTASTQWLTLKSCSCPWPWPVAEGSREAKASLLLVARGVGLFRQEPMMGRLTSGLAKHFIELNWILIISTDFLFFLHDSGSDHVTHFIYIFTVISSNTFLAGLIWWWLLLWWPEPTHWWSSKSYSFY